MWRVVSILILLLPAAVARAQDIPAITFAEATGFVDALPEVAQRRSAAAITAESAGALPLGWSPLAIRVMPQLGLGTPAGPGVRFGIEQAVPLASRRDAAHAVVDANARRRAAEAAALAYEARLEIARVWIDSWVAEATLAEAVHSRELATQIVTITERGRAAGATTEPELADARALLATANTAVLDAEGRAKDASFQLAAAVGADGPRRATGELPRVELPDVATQRARIAATEHMPAVRALRLDALAARARAAEARALRSTELLLGAEVTLDPGSDHRIAATVGFAWGLHDRGQRDRAEALAEATRIEGDAANAARRARFALEQALHDVEHSGELLDEVDQRLLPAVEDAAARRRRAFELGESTVLEVLAAERTALAGRATALAARADHAWARVRARILLDAGGTP